MNKNVINILVFVLLSLLVVCSVEILLILSGVEAVLFAAAVSICIEGFLTVSAIENSKSWTSAWVGFAFHIVGFGWTVLIALNKGVWLKPFEYELDKGHGVLTLETSPAYLWWILVGLIVFRIILQSRYYFLWRKVSKQWQYQNSIQYLDAIFLITKNLY